MIDLPTALVLALGTSSFAAGLLLGIFVGFRVVTRDASLLAVLDKRAAHALTASSEAAARASLLEATWEEHLAELERKRAKARAERQRADQSSAKVEAADAAEEAPAPIPIELSPRERRRMLGRGLSSGRGIGG